MYDLAIVGGGPGGVAAGVYAARKKIKTVLLTDFFGGQSLVSTDVQNWIGVKSISGFELAKSLEEHLRSQEDLEVVVDNVVKKIDRGENNTGEQHFTLTTNQGRRFEAKAVLIVSGSHHKRLGVSGEKEFESRGVVYCATCDAPLFKDKVVAVVGGGNSGLEAVVDLTSYATNIYLLHRRDELRGDSVTQEKVISHPRVQVIWNAETQEICGDTAVRSLRYKDKITGEMKELGVDGVFVEIGSLPNSDLVKNLLELNGRGEIMVDHKTQKTSCEGIWAAGDVTDVLYKQNNISAGDAIKAVLNIYDYLHNFKR